MTRRFGSISARWLAKAALPVLAIALFSGCATAPPPSEASAPAGWERVERHSYEDRNPGLGVSHKYRSSQGWIDVYVYQLQRGAWAPGVADAQFSAHFESTIDEVRYHAKRGTYADLKLGRIHDVKISGVDFRTVAFQFLLSGRPIESRTYLTAVNGVLLKYRMSFQAHVLADIDSVARRFIEEDMRKPPEPRGAKPPAPRNNTGRLPVALDNQRLPRYLATR